MGEAIAYFIIIFGNQLAYHLGRLLLTICCFGKLSIEPLAKNYAANFVQAFDDQKVEQLATKRHYNISHTMVIVIGYVIIITVFSAGLIYFSEVLFAQKLRSIS